MQRKGIKKGKKKQQQKVQDHESEQMNEEDDLNLMDQNMGIDQLQLTQEEKDESVIKTLTANNPQAAHNVCQFSFKDRHFKVDDQVDMLKMHVEFEGNIMLKDSDEAMDQETFWDDKKRRD